MLYGQKPEFRSLEESLAVSTLNRRAEIEFLKVTAIVNAIITVGNGIRSAVSGSTDAPSSDALNKSLDALKEAMLPHWSEDTNRRAKEAKAKLMEEMNRGPLKIQVMGKDKKGKRRSF